MNIVRKDIDAVNAQVIITLQKEDYAEKVEKSLKDYRRKANIPGFRPGMVPVGLVKKMYGKAVLAEEVNRVVSEGLYNYINENKINILGEPLPNETEQKAVDFDNEESFEFVFDLGIAPEITVALNGKDKVPFYEIAITKEMEDEQIDQYANRFGEYKQADAVEAGDMIKGNMLEMANGAVNEGGLNVTDAVLTPAYIKDEEQQKRFIGAKKGDKIVFNPKKAFENEAELASLLKVSKDEVKVFDGDFEIEIHGITRHAKAELDQAFFDKVLGPGAVTSEAEFRAKINEGISEAYAADSEYKFKLDAKKLLVEKFGDVSLPDAFLKRWVLTTNENMTEETLEKEYPDMANELKWYRMRESLATANDLKVEQADVDAYARKSARIQFAQYGMTNVPDDILDNYVKDVMRKEDSVRSFYDKALEDKVMEVVKANVKLDIKKVTFAEFNKMFEEA